MEQGIVHAWKLNITTIQFSSDHVQIGYSFYGLKFLGIASFKCILCIAEAGERQHIISEQFLIQNRVFLKGSLAYLNEVLKYCNKDHPLWFCKRIAHFQMNLMLIESIKLIGTEVKLLFIFTDYRKAEAE